MTDPQPITFLCMTSEFKGMPLIEACRNLGCHVILLTKEKWKNEAWPRASIDELYFMPDLSKRQDVIHAVSYLERGRHIDRIFPLDDFDGEMAAALREHLAYQGWAKRLSGSSVTSSPCASRRAPTASTCRNLSAY